ADESLQIIAEQGVDIVDDFQSCKGYEFEDTASELKQSKKKLQEKKISRSSYGGNVIFFGNFAQKSWHQFCMYSKKQHMGAL
ncbi:MAG: hypothetical protein WCG61_05260, partial [Chlorobium sp.]